MKDYIKALSSIKPFIQTMNEKIPVFGDDFKNDGVCQQNFSRWLEHKMFPYLNRNYNSISSVIFALGKYYDNDHAHIVKCVNSHDYLVAALERARSRLGYFYREVSSPRFTDRHGDAGATKEVLDMIDAALESVK